VPKNKVVPIEEAMSHVESGMSIAVGGFIGQGDPLTLIDCLKTMDVKDLTIYENGAIGVGPAPEPGGEDRDRANAGNQPITLIPRGSCLTPRRRSA